MTADKGQRPETDIMQHTKHRRIDWKRSFELMREKRNELRESLDAALREINEAPFVDLHALTERAEAAEQRALSAERRADEAREAALEDAANVCEFYYLTGNSYMDGYKAGCNDSATKIRALKSGGAGEGWK